jgi:hypothetical protein
MGRIFFEKFFKRVAYTTGKPPCSYAFLDSRHALFHLYRDVGMLYENMLEAYSYGPCQAL